MNNAIIYIGENDIRFPEENKIIETLNHVFGTNKFTNPISKKNYPRTLSRIIRKCLVHLEFFKQTIISISYTQLCNEYELQIFNLLHLIYSIKNKNGKNKQEKKNNDKIKLISLLTFMNKIITKYKFNSLSFELIKRQYNKDGYIYKYKMK